MTNYNNLNQQIDALPTISIRIDKKHLINQLKSLQDNFIEILINPKHLKTISLKDRFNYNTMQTKN